MNAENLRQIATLPLGSAAGTLAALFANTDILVKKVTLMNGAALAADNTNYVTVSLKNGSAVVASYDSRAAAQGALASLTGKAALVDPAAAGAALVTAGSTLSAVIVFAGSGALTAGLLQVEYVRNKNN